MSIDLTRTQPVKKDQLGLTLRERMWLARAAVSTIVLSAVAFAGLLTMLPEEHAAPVTPMETRLAARESAPIRPSVPIEPLPLPEVQRPAATFVVAEPPPPPPPVVPVMPVVRAPVVVIERGSSSKQKHKGGKSTVREVYAAPAVDLSRPQALAPTRAPEPAPEPEPVKAAPVAEEPALKRPAFE